MKHLNRNAILILKITAAILVACLSLFLAAPLATSEETHASEVAYLDAKKSQVLEITAGSTLASVGISAIPDDTATPIANQLADFSDYFLIILAANYLERFLISIIGYASFTVLIPAACAFYIFFLLTKNDTLKDVAAKSVLLALALYFIIPSSVAVARMIEERNSTTIQETINMTRLEMEDDGEKESDGIIGWFKDLGDNVTAGISYAKTILNYYIDALAIMIVTSCLLPVFIALLFFWLTKIILGINLQPKVVRIVGKGRSYLHSSGPAALNPREPDDME